MHRRSATFDGLIWVWGYLKSSNRTRHEPYRAAVTFSFHCEFLSSSSFCGFPARERDIATTESNFVLLSFQSEMIEQDIIMLLEQYQIPLIFQLEVSRPDDRVYHLPLRCMGFYEECFWTGLRLPLHLFFVILLQYFKISLCTVVPNAWQHICRFTAVCVLTEVVPNVTFFRFLLNLKRHPDSRGWWYVTPWRKKDGFCLIFLGMPSTVRDWKPRFFFIS